MFPKWGIWIVCILSRRQVIILLHYTVCPTAQYHPCFGDLPSFIRQSTRVLSSKELINFPLISDIVIFLFQIIAPEFEYIEKKNCLLCILSESCQDPDFKDFTKTYILLNARAPVYPWIHWKNCNQLKRSWFLELNWIYNNSLYKQ